MHNFFKHTKKQTKNRLTHSMGGHVSAEVNVVVTGDDDESRFALEK